MSASPRNLARTARELGRRAAVVAALAVALLSLLLHAPVWLASARGAVTLVVLAAVARIGAAALERAAELDLSGRKPR